MATIPTPGIANATSLKDANNTEVNNKEVKKDDVLTLAGTADNASRKVKITLTGAVFQGTDDTEGRDRHIDHETIVVELSSG